MGGEDLKVDLIVCGRFHYHKYLHFLYKKNILHKFIYSYKRKYNFGIPKSFLLNFPLKEYLMYAGKKVLPTALFYKYLSVLHNIWQMQVLQCTPKANIAHVLVHGNCNKIIKKYKASGIKVIGEVVNVHPLLQEKILNSEYEKYGMQYRSGEVSFRDKIIHELSICDYLLAPSNFIKNSLVLCGINEERIITLPYGIETIANDGKKKMSTIIRPGQVIKILCVAQITFRKGIIYLLKAIGPLTDNGFNVEVTLVGAMDAAYEHIIKTYLEKYPVTVIRHIDNAIMCDFMAEFDLLVIPSIEDGFGVVVFEAISVNLPVIITKSMGASEIIEHGKNGFIIEPSSYQAIYDAVANAVGYRFDFNGNWLPTWADYADGIAAIYSKILN
jgi:glycosyltransferase involved in cell wall biosynthesis